LIYENKEKQNDITPSEELKLNIMETDAKPLPPNTLILDLSLCWYITGTSIKKRARMYEQDPPLGGKMCSVE
jgi:hypothetical protein